MKNPSAYISKTLSLLIIIFSLIALAGWFFNIPSLTTTLFGSNKIRFNAAFCFLLSGTIIYLMDVSEISRSRKTAITFLSVVVLFVGIITFSEYIFVWNAGIDELLWKDNLSPFQGRMSITAAFDFILTGAIFLLLLRKRKFYLTGQIFLSLIILTSLFIIINNYIGESFFHNFSLFSSTANIVALLCILLVIAIIYNQQLDKMAFSYSKKLSGYSIIFAVFVSVIIWGDFANNNNRSETKKWVAHTHEVIVTAQKLNKKIEDLQIEIRDYIFAGEKKYLPEFNKIDNATDSLINKLRMLTADDVHQNMLIDSIDRFIDIYLKSREELINIRQQKGFTGARQSFIASQVLLAIDKIAVLSENFLQQKNQLLDKRETENEKFIANNTKILSLLQFLILLLIITVGVTIYKYQKIGEEKEKEIQQFLTLFNVSSDMMCIADPQGAIKKANPAFTETLGYPEGELISKPFIDLIIPEDKQITIDKMARQMQFGHTLNFEKRYLCKDGSFRWLSWRASFLKADGITYAIARDITEQKKAEEEIKKSNRIIKFISEINELILFAKDENEIYNQLSKIAVESGNFVFAWIGIPDTETKTIKAFSWAGKEEGYLKGNFFSTEDISLGKGPVGKTYREAKYYYSNDVEHDPIMKPWRVDAITRGYYSLVSFPLMIDDTVVSIYTMYAATANFFTKEELQLLVKVTNNINYALTAINNNRKRNEGEIQIKKITRAIEQSHASILITNLDASIEYVNPAFTELSGYSYEEVVGKNPRILQSGLTPPSTYTKLWQNLIEGIPWQGELCNRNKNGELYWEQAIISPITNEEGEITSYVAVKENITERRMINKKLRNIAWHQSHQIRGPLTSIMGIIGAMKFKISIEEKLALLSSLDEAAKKLDIAVRTIVDEATSTKL